MAIDSKIDFACEFCGTRIRWIHVLAHDDYHRTVEAGRCCAAKFCFDYDAEATERELKNRTSRLMRFVDPSKWKRSMRNPENIWRRIRTSEGLVTVTVFLKEARYMIYFVGKGDDRHCHSEKFGCQSEAKHVAFELIEQLRPDA